MEIVQLEPDDKQTFLEQCRDFYNGDATLRPFDEGCALATFNRVMEKHENLWGYKLIDRETSEFIGYALVSSYWCNEEGGNVLVLDELYISPKSRHHGYAGRFMKWMEEHFKNYAKQITLEVLTTNQTARSLYTKDGMAPDGFVTYSKDIQ